MALAEAPNFVTFPTNEGPVTPAELYQTIHYQMADTPRSDIYFRGPLTTGGAIRLYAHLTGEERTAATWQAYDQNSQFKEAVVGLLLPDLGSHKIIIPHKIGKVSGWGSGEYNGLCSYMLAGISPEAAAEFEQRVVQDRLVDFAAMNNHHLDRSASQAAHIAYIDAYTSYITNRNVTTNPAKRVISLPDTHMSFGSMMEEHLAQFLGIRMDNVYFDNNHPQYNRIARSAPWLELIPEEHSPFRALRGQLFAVLPAQS